MTLASVSPAGAPDVPARPVWHFVPPSGWMNDPNGLIRDGDTYHLFYQHNPAATVWGNIHWGHATSTDLVTWRHHDLALHPDEDGLPFSGCVVETDDRWVAVYTADREGEQSQCLAVSADRGATWESFTGNPVLVRPDGAPVDFRDPKVLDLADGSSHGRWLMLLAVGTEVWSYRSPDLTAWVRVGAHRPFPDRDGIVVEVPDLLRLTDDDGVERDVLLFSVIPAPDEDPTRTVFAQVGELTAGGFVAGAPPMPVDLGQSFYAATAWPRLPDGSTVAIGWMNETASTADRDPVWCGRQSVARRLSLRREGPGWSMVQEPVLPSLQSRPMHLAAGTTEVELGPAAVVTAAIDPGFELALGSFRAAVDPTSSLLRVESIDGAGVVAVERGQSVRLVVDSGSIEVFLGDGPSASFVTDVDLPGSLRVHTAVPSTIEVAEAVEGSDR